MHRYFAVIPARKNSKGIKHKNLQKIGQKPMLQYTFDAALGSGALDFIILSSDDPDAISLASQSGIHAPFNRPAILSQDNSKSTDVFFHALDWYQTEFSGYPDNIVVLQPTSPFRTGEDINNAIHQYEKSKADSLVSVCDLTQHPSDCITLDDRGRVTRVLLEVDKKKIGRQAYQQVYFIDGGIYISSVQRFLQERTLFDNHSAISIINRSHAIDVDHPFDLEIARAMHAYKSNCETELFNL
jgi:CMP-N-acetylneuraminic acid synthetase